MKDTIAPGPFRRRLLPETKVEIVEYIQQNPNAGYTEYMNYFGQVGEHPVATTTYTRIKDNPGKVMAKVSGNSAGIIETSRKANKYKNYTYRTVYMSETKDHVVAVKEMLETLQENVMMPRLEVVMLEDGFEVREFNK
jgi:hypothetical protein